MHGMTLNVVLADLAVPENKHRNIMKNFALLVLIAVLTACGGNSEPPVMPKVVTLSDQTVATLPTPFVAGPAGTVTVPSVPVVGPGPAAQLPFVVGPVKGPEVTVIPNVVVGPSLVVQPTINYCTDGFVVGPCVKLSNTCTPDASGFVIGPCTQ